MQDANATFAGSIPEIYDRYLGPIKFERYASDLAGRLTPKGLKDVLEIACGSGIATRALREKLPATVRLVATDLSEPMVAYARSKPGGVSGVEWRQADAAALPFPENSFDAVVCQFGVMFVPEKAAAMREARRVLRPGGTFAFNVWDRLEENPLGQIAHETIAGFFAQDPPQFYTVPFGFYDQEQIRLLLREAGFTDVFIEPVSFEVEIRSTMDAAIGLVRGTPVLTAIQERGGVEVDTVVAAVAEALRERLKGDPLRARMKALVVLAA